MVAAERVPILERVDEPSGRRLARSTAIFSLATGVSRVLGLIREIVAKNYFGVRGPVNAFEVAFLVPNTVRALVADAALSSAFVPVFSDLLEKGDRKRAWRVASSLFWLTLLGLGGVTALFILVAPWVMPPLYPHYHSLLVGLSQILFPIVALLGVSGIVVGILNTYGEFSVPALTPVAWNLVIIAGLVFGVPHVDGSDKLYVYAGSILLGTIVQVLLPLPWLRGRDGRLQVVLDWRDPAVRQVFKLMLPVALGLGLININALIDAVIGGWLISPNAPASINAAFRIYMLPQGIFSVAIATVLFPALSRLAARRDLDGLRSLTANGMRQVLLLLIPAAAATLTLATPIVRLIYQHGEFGPGSTELVSDALFWFSFSLPTSGVNLLLTRTFFSLQRPWITTAIAGLNLAVNVAVSVALYEPFGIAGIVVGTAAGSLAMTLAQAYALRRELHGRLEARETLAALARMLVAAAALAGVAYGTWWSLDQLLGRGIAGQVVSVCGGLLAGAAVYAALVLALRVREAAQIRSLVAGRLSRHGRRRP
jgi:putative peptidoglycan lipid II flippase